MVTPLPPDFDWERYWEDDPRTQNLIADNQDQADRIRELESLLVDWLALAESIRHLPKLSVSRGRLKHLILRTESWMENVPE